MKKWIIIFCLVFSSIVNAKVFNASEAYLDNGLRVVVIPNHKAPIIKQMLWYNVGSSDEKLGQGGTAHLLEHLMFRGTSKIKGQRFNQIMEENGIDSNAFTSIDFTAYHQLMDISKLELAMFLEADRMQNLSLSKKDFELERDIVWEERKQVIENSPVSHFSETMNRYFWQEHPYGRPITGMSDEIKSLQHKNIKSFYKAYYSPNNATLVLAGDIDPNQAFSLAKKYYGHLKSGAKNEVYDYSRDKKFNAKLSMNLEDVQTPRFHKIYDAPRGAYALDVLSKYLGDGQTSKLHKKMVERDKSALAVSTNYNGWAKLNGSFSISVIPTKKFDLEKLLDESLTEIDEKELAQTKKKMLAGLVYIKDNPSDEASAIGAMLMSGMSLDEAENYEANINKVSLDEVKMLALKMCKKSSSLQGDLND